MAIDFDGSDDKVSASFDRVTDYPITMACHFRSAGGYGALFTYANDASNAAYLGLYMDGTQAGNPAGIDTRNPTVQELRTANGFTDNAWSTLVGVWTSATERKVVLDGDFANQASSTTSITWPVASSRVIGIGFLNRTTDADLSDADIAECAIWNVALTDAEITSYSRGMSPMLIRPSALVFHAPLIREVQELRGTTLSSAGSPAVAPHPRVFNPAPPQQRWWSPAAVVANTRRYSLPLSGVG